MKHYEELAGGAGEQMYYREPKTSARDLFPRIRPDAQVEGAPAALDSIGVAEALVRLDRSADVGRLPAPVRLTIALAGEVLFDGPAEVAGREVDRLGDLLRLRPVGAWFDPEAMRAAHDRATAIDAASGFAPRADAVAPAYRRLCADAVHGLRTYTSALERHERRHGAAAARALAFEMAPSAVAAFDQVWTAANALVRPLADDVAALRAVKAYTETVLTPELMPSPPFARAYLKPLGYPGDHLVMDHIYRSVDEGSDAPSALIHQIALDIGRPIVTRMEMMRADIRQMLDAAAAEGRAEPARIANIGCGTAQEVRDVLAAERLAHPVAFTLIDQDRQALDFVHRRAHPRVVAHAGAAGLEMLHASFVQLMKAGQLFRALPPQDMIYSVGLVDYLNARRANNLVKSLLEQVRPGGKVVIGNMKDAPRGNFWPMEVLLDWTIIFRDHEQMRAMAEGTDAAEVRVDDDPTGRVCMLTVVKKA